MKLKKLTQKQEIARLDNVVSQLYVGFKRMDDILAGVLMDIKDIKNETEEETSKEEGQ